MLYSKLQCYSFQIKLTFAVCMACFLLGLPCVSASGSFVLDLMDTYGAGFSVFFIGMCEIISFMWLYGYRNVSKDIKLMLGFEPMWYWKMCWAFLAPAFLITIFLLSIFTWKDFKFAGVVPYPDWAHTVGKLLILLSALQVPLWATLTMIVYKIRGEKVSNVLKPNKHWGPGDKYTAMTTSDKRYRKIN